MSTETFFDPKTKSVRPTGEPFVWFTGMGLTLGLLMIMFLLGLILVKGTEIFWPKKVATISIVSSKEGGATRKIAGVITKDQVREDAERELQLFVGNKDAYGHNFEFIDYADIQEKVFENEILKIERMEYGPAIGYPVALKLSSGEILSANSPVFIDTLHELTEEAVSRWKKVRHIEKKQIGKINSSLLKLKLKQKALIAKENINEQKLHNVKEKITKLEARYDTLAKEARALRNIQTENSFVYHLPSGVERQMTVGNIVDFYFPNKLNTFDRIGMFFHNIWIFLSTEPREANTEGGVFPAIFGTFIMTVLMSVAVTPFGVIAAIYLREYAKQGVFVRAVRIAVNNLAGVPSIVFGVFGLGFFVYFVGGTIDQLFFSESLPTPTFGTGGILWASLTLALLTVPVVIVATEEALAAVPRGMREGSLACGASKWQTILRIVLPAAAPGILTGLILAMARGAGEVAPLMLVGVVKLAPNLPLDGIFPFLHMERKFMHLGFHIYDLGFQSPDSEAAKPMVFATTLLLITIVLVLNLGAILIRQRLRKKYAMGVF